MERRTNFPHSVRFYGSCFRREYPERLVLHGLLAGDDGLADLKKFLLQLLIVCGSTLAYLVLAALVSLVLRTFEVKAFCNMLFAAWLVLWVVLLMGSVSTLLLFRFPPEYARLISILIYVIPACAFMGAGSVFMQKMTDNLATLPAEFSAMLLPAAIAMPALSLVVSGLCYIFSCRIFQKKDLA